MAYKKAGIWTTLAAEALAWAGDAKTNAVTAAAPEQPAAKVAKADSPEKEFARHIEALKAGLAPRFSKDEKTNVLIRQLEDSNPKKRDKAKAQLDKKIEVLIQQLDDDDFLTRERASAALFYIAPYAETQLTIAANTTKPELKRRAARILEESRTADASRIKALVSHIQWLGQFSTKREITIPLFFEALRKPYLITEHKVDTTLQVAAFRALDTLDAFSPAAKDAVPALKNLLDQPHANGDIHGDISKSLVEIRSDATDVPELMKELRDKNYSWRIRWAAAIALKKSGPKAKDQWNDLVLLLCEILGDHQEGGYLKMSCSYAIGTIAIAAKGDDDMSKLFSTHAVPALIPGLKKNWMEQLASIEALKNIGLAANAALPALRQLKTDTWQIQEARNNAIKAIEGKKKEK